MTLKRLEIVKNIENIEIHYTMVVEHNAESGHEISLAVLPVIPLYSHFILFQLIPNEF